MEEKFYKSQLKKFPEFIQINNKNYRLFGYKLMSGGYYMGYTYIDWTTEDGSNGIRQNIISTMVHIKGDKPMIIECGEFGDSVSEPSEILCVDRIIGDFTRKFNGLKNVIIISKEDTEKGKEKIYEY